MIRISSITSETFQFQYFSFSYTAKSNADVITFSFNKGWDWYLDDLSVRDVLTNTELVDDGGFESGTLNSYCVCFESFEPSTITHTKHSGSYACEAQNFFGDTKISQSLNTIPNRNYNISFWLYKHTSWESPLTVYMNKANQYSFLSIWLPLILIFLI